jgi:hypothetical protein
MLTTRSVFAGGGCAGLMTASAGELLSIPERNAPNFLLAPTVTCTWHNLETEPVVCRSRRIIIKDRMLDSEHRLIVSRRNKVAQLSLQQLSGVPDKRPWDFNAIYACVDGRVKTVYAGGLHAGGSIEPVAPGKFIESDSYQSGDELVRYQKTFYWHPELEAYIAADQENAPLPPTRERISCNEMENLKAARIIGLATDGLLQYTHGFGLYDDGEYDVTLRADRMFGDHRRLLTVERNHLKGAGVVDDQLVFACVSGSIRPVFQNQDVAIRDATEDKLVMYLEAPNPKHRFKPFEVVYTYTWNPGLGDYVLTNVNSYPQPPWKPPLEAHP